MTREQKLEIDLERYIGCFGAYRKDDLICRKKCALNVRCAIEHDQNERFEILEELVSGSGMVIRVN